MPIYTRAELLAIKEKMAAKKNSSQSQQQSVNAGLQSEKASPTRYLWEKTEDIQKHIEALHVTAEQRKLMVGGQDERAVKVFRAAKISLANYHSQLEKQIYAIIVMGMPPMMHSLKPTFDKKSGLELIGTLKKHVEEHSQHMKQLQKLLQEQMMVLQKRFVEIDVAIKQLNKDYKKDVSLAKRRNE